MAENRVVVGVFAEQALAEQALVELRENGFRDEQIGFIIRGADKGTPTEKLEGEAIDSATIDKEATTTGAVTGGVVGGVVGAAVALLIPGIGPAIAGGILSTTLGGAVVGAATGGIIGAFTHMGVSEEQARYYEQELQHGRTIIIVQADERPMDAFNILKRNRAYDADPPEAAQQENSIYDRGATSKLDEAS